MLLASDLNINNNNVKNFCIESLSSAPEIIKRGRIWIDEQSGTLKLASSSIDSSLSPVAIFDEKTWGEYTKESNISLNTLQILGDDSSSSTDTGALTVTGGVGIKGSLNADSISGAVWNDYAEYREIDQEVEAGYCVCENGDGKVSLSTKRLQKLPMIVSDTFGFSIGKINETDVPIAVCGRVLAYTDKPISKFRIGDWVCAGKNGRISKMNFIERLFFPDRKVGIVSSFPSQETWGSGNVPTKDRIWIRI